MCFGKEAWNRLEVVGFSLLEEIWKSTLGFSVDKLVYCYLSAWVVVDINPRTIIPRSE